MEQVRQVLKKAFNIHGDSASYEEIEERILSGGEVRGTNLCILVLAIFIASIGLNMNSTAVIIGAMLISPLMGGIMAIGYGLATGDFIQARNSSVGLLVQVFVCLVISTLYFTFSPISTASSELLARTNPTIWDVLIASFGGFAGIIGTTRKEKSNVIPGVAIATALMPPLCTAGYGLATKNLSYFGGAMYLFLINTYFICFTTVIGLQVLKVPVKKTVSPEVRKKIRRRAFQSTMIMIIPSLIFGYRMVVQELNTSQTVHSTNMGSIDVERITKELKVLYPQIDEIQIGYLVNYDEESDQNQEELTVLIYCNDKISEKNQEILTKLLKIDTDSDDIRFVMR